MTKFALGAIKAVVRANKKLFAFAFALYWNGSSTNNKTIPGRKPAFAFAVAGALCINGPFLRLINHVNKYTTTIPKMENWV